MSDSYKQKKRSSAEWKTLADITEKWYTGETSETSNHDYYKNGNIPWLRTKEVRFSDIYSTEIKITQDALDNSQAKWVPENCVIIALSGTAAGRSAVNKIPLTTNQSCISLKIDSSKALYRYVFHWLNFTYRNLKALGQGIRGDLNQDIIRNFRIPLPFADDPDRSVTEQKRIVQILDRFKTVTESVSESLLHETELRKKQYEYYRDMLLDFKNTVGIISK